MKEPLKFQVSSLSIPRVVVNPPEGLAEDTQMIPGFKTAITIGKDVLIVRTLIVLETVGENPKRVVEIETHIGFSIEDMETHVKKEDNYFQMSESLLTTFVSISYSTTRGVVSEKLSNTPYNILLPIIYPSDVVENFKEQGLFKPLQEDEKSKREK